MLKTICRTKETFAIFFEFIYILLTIIFYWHEIEFDIFVIHLVYTHAKQNIVNQNIQISKNGKNENCKNIKDILQEDIDC